MVTWIWTSLKVSVSVRRGCGRSNSELRSPSALSGNLAICKAPPAACDSGIVSSKLQLQRLAQTTLDRDCRTRFGRT